MSNIIPPLLSNTPPPPPSPEDDDDDEFGDFTGVNDLSYGCDVLSLPPSPDHSPKKASISYGLDINSNSEKNKIVQEDLGVDKDFQDKRKSDENISELCTVEEKHIDSLEKKNSQCSIDRIIDNQHMQDNIPEDASDAELKNHCNLSPLAHISEQQKDLETENKSLSIQPTLDCRISVDNKQTKNIFSTEKKDNSLNCTVDSNFKEENCILNNGLEVKLNLEQKDLDNVTRETHICKLSHEVMTKTLELNDDIYTQKSFVQEDIPDLTEESEEENRKTSHQSLNDWNSSENDKSLENNENINSEEICASDEFADFAFADTQCKNQIEATSCSEIRSDNLNKIANSNFSEESNCEQILHSDNSPKVPTETISDITDKVTDDPVGDDDFDDFCDFTSNTFVQESQQEKLEVSPSQNDDFGNFANFAEVVEEPVFLLLNEKQALEKADSILKEMFPPSSTIKEEYQYVEVESKDFIFNELKDVTETNALTYLWSKSASQNMLLKALNIDARNILYGASWNPSMPRFAANLGLTPLEPIKSEIPPCALKSSPSTSSQPSSSDIPSAQFDWNGSGLVNPLDYSQTMLLDLEQLVASLDIPTCNASTNSNHSSSPANELNDWDIWLQSVPKDSVEVPQIIGERKSLESGEQSILQPQIVDKPVASQKVPSKNDLEQEVMSEENTDDFEDFTSYQSPTRSNTWQNVVPLRETYISNDTKELPLDITNWLQPTIVTPELPRKDLDIGDEELPNIQTPEFTRKEVVTLEENDDDFDDFQMVLPGTSSVEIKNSISSDFLQAMEPERREPTVSNLNMVSADFQSFTFPEEKPKVESTADFVSDVTQNRASLGTNTAKKEPVIADDEDDFTEFHSSVPASYPTVPKPLTPILEPLKPIPMYTTVSTAPTQINWPDPGITDDEIKKFEMVFKRPQEYNNSVEKKKEMPTKNSEQKNKTSKDSSFDDEEWSDFVSVQKPSPVHKFHSSEKERTSSPDLPLSVLNLGNIQPTKQPIPVITPQGLIQTKLSSSNSPKLQLKNNSIGSQQKTVYPKPQIQPSLISSQFASQVYNFNNGNLSQNKAVLNFPVNQPHGASSNLQSTDDDDWSDFISSPLPPTTSNGYQQNWQNTTTYKQSNWTNPSPNIINNPRHFVQSGSDMKNRKVSNVSVNSKKSTVPSISLPDLEFIAPKERTSSSRKK